ncbi:MAG: DHH family phosphoesterase, partial [Ruminococcus sp.]|nr:DHH family phosphoesterase [Ruminococcus sp.]
MKKKFPAVFFTLITAILAEQILISLSLYNYNKLYGLIGIISSAVLIAVLTIVSIIYSKNFIRHIVKMNNHLENSAAEYMNNLPAPIAVINSEKQFVWYNQEFSDKISYGSDVFGLDFEEYINLEPNSLIANGTSLCHINDSIYSVTCEKFEENELSFFIIYFHDQTEYMNLKKKCEESHPNVVILTIDTYDEIMQNAKESEKAQASLEIEQLIEKFMSSTDGFVKKTSSNTFYAVIEKQHLDKKINDKFKILDMARDIKIAGKYPLTFSIGVGLGADSLSESEKIARQCLDMALGRGGDQAVIKSDNGYQFFGGVSKGVEKMSRTKTRIIANAMQDVIMNSDKVFIMGHHHGDLDSVGSSCGLAGAMKLLGKETRIVVDKANNLAMPLVDYVESQTDGPLFISPVEAINLADENDLLIIVDTHNENCIESSELYNKMRQVIVIDHHRKAVNFIKNAVIFHHEPYASSASEMVTEIIQYFNFSRDEKLPVYHAEALLSGIMLDTKNFVMRTGVRTFEAAAFLKKLGADTVSVKLLFSNSFESYKRRTEIVSTAKIHNNCAIAIADLQSDDMRIVAPQAADEMLGITGVNASFVIYKTDSTINISARSFGAINVQVIMETLHGGGHQTMAATQLKDMTIEEAYEALINAIDQRLNEVN